MIELANDPRASRSSFERAVPGGESKGAAAQEPRARNGHAWPFLSRYAARPARQENTDKPAAQDSGS